jgi:hypothetical protein
MSEPRIRWHDEPVNGESMGSVGTLDPAVFRIWAPEEEGGEWLLTAAALPGEAGKRRYGASPDDLKAEAERWLEEFVSSLGAVFPPVPGDAFGRVPASDYQPSDYARASRVRYAYPENGWPEDRERAAELLTPGEVYAVSRCTVSDSVTRLELMGVPGAWNSVLFEPVADED